MKTASSLPLVCLLFLSSCNSASPSASPSPSASASPSASPSPSLFERLATEQSSRSPTTAPRTETVHAALAARGLIIDRWKQVLASPVGARFCMAGSTDLGVGVAVCEYDRPEAAAAGRDRSRAVFDRLIPGRELLIRGTTLLTLTSPASDPSATAQARRITDAFATL